MSAQNADSAHEAVLRLDRMTEIVLQEIALRMCDRMKKDWAAPTCRSPVPAERRDESLWCLSCLAREVTESD